MKESCADGSRRDLLKAFRWTSFSGPLCLSLWTKPTTSCRHEEQIQMTQSFILLHLITLFLPRYLPLTCSPGSVSMAASCCSSSSFRRSLLLTSCLSLRACRSTTTEHLQISHNALLQSADGSKLHLANQCKDNHIQTTDLSNSETMLLYSVY